METIFILVVFCCTLLFFFLLLYPFYLRDNKPEQYNGIWLFIGEILKGRHRSLFIINIYLGMLIGTIVSQQTNNSHLGAASLAIWIFSFYVLFLLHPYNLKHYRPEKYTGLWRIIGEWSIGNAPKKK
jgi:uncharacterized membrane protein YozB (DUF420 family)